MIVISLNIKGISSSTPEKNIGQKILMHSKSCTPEKNIGQKILMHSKSCTPYSYYRLSYKM